MKILSRVENVPILGLLSDIVGNISTKVKKSFSHDYDKERRFRSLEEHSILGTKIGALLLFVLWIALISPLVNYLCRGLYQLGLWFKNPKSHGVFINDFSTLKPLYNAWHWEIDHFFDYSIMKVHPKLYTFLLILMGGVMIPLILRIYNRNKPNRNNVYGNDRLTTISELMVQYPQISDRQNTFKGYGGIPVAHVNAWNGNLIFHHPIIFFRDYFVPRLLGNRAAKGFYSIDQTTNNSLIVGITRSGKGETLIMPLIDILSRATEKSSMVVNDPKGELYQMAYKVLRKRGYNVQVLNMLDTSFSMAYNPLANIIKLAKNGYYDELQQEVNKISSAIYTDPNAKDKFWQNSSINLLNALILAIVDYAKRNNKWSVITMDNVVHMMTSLGSKQKNIDSQGNVIPDDDTETPIAGTKSLLTIYFESLAEKNDHEYSPIRQMAHDAFAQSKFAGEETAGNIYSSAMEGIKIYLQTNIAKLTSLNSVNFESLGFPRVFQVKLPRNNIPGSTAREHVLWEFQDQAGNIIEKGKQVIDTVGFVRIALKNTLPDRFRIVLRLKQDKSIYATIVGTKVFYRTGFGKQKKYKLDEYTGKKLLKNIDLRVTHNSFKDDISKLKLDYSESPTAIFLVTPPNNPSYNQLVSFAVDQAFSQVYDIALKNGRKAYTRVHFILDEFGNLPPIDKMKTKVSIGLGQGILFDIVVQNFEQLESQYSKGEAATIKSNCSNLLYILTQSKETAQEISTMMGKQTSTVKTTSGKKFDPHSTNYSQQFKDQDLITASELTNFQGGEMVTLRAVYRQDNRGNSISAMPIFAHGSTTMPFRFTFLDKEFDQSATMADIDVDAPHRNMDILDYRIDFEQALMQIQNSDSNSTEASSNDDFRSLFFQNADDSFDNSSENTIFSKQELKDSKLMRSVALLVNRYFNSEIISGPFYREFWEGYNSYDKLAKLEQGSGNINELINVIEKLKTTA